MKCPNCKYDLNQLFQEEKDNPLKKIVSLAKVYFHDDGIIVVLPDENVPSLIKKMAIQLVLKGNIEYEFEC